MNESYKQFTEYIQTEPWPIARRTFIIGEIGINHNGDVEVAKRLIDMACECGCDAVKFQKRNIDIVYTKEFLAAPRKSPWGETQREQKEGLEFGEAQYDEIDSYCRKVGMEWFASAWDVDSQRFLRKYNCCYNKIASAMLTHGELLKEVAGEGKMTFVSTGMSSYAEIDVAVELFLSRRCPFILMHTVSEYPADDAVLNLGVILELRRRYNCPVGYSGHETSVSPSVVAAVMGAVAIERHITLDRAMYGSDQAASLEKTGLSLLVGQVRKIGDVIGDGVKRISTVESENARKLKYWRADDDAN